MNDNEIWQNLDFQQEVRPVQLKKMDKERDHIEQIAKELQLHNEKNLAQIDIAAKQTDDLEKKLIDRKMDNENLITETETNRLKFIQQFAETSRGTESLND